ncbi:hypothetical protein G6F57_020100 [Rhizopus arrhizus]|nr:hypothetical protein G6F57_020100 [Rhizopus arrhizus]
MFTYPGLGDSESRALFVDPVTLDIKGDMIVYGTSGTLPFRTALDYLHRNLMLGEVGRNYSELAASWMWLATLGGLPASEDAPLAHAVGLVAGGGAVVPVCDGPDLVELGRRARGSTAGAIGLDHAVRVSEAAGRRDAACAGRGRTRASSWRHGRHGNAAGGSTFGRHRSHPGRRARRRHR